MVAAAALGGLDLDLKLAELKINGVRHLPCRPANATPSPTLPAA